MRRPQDLPPRPPRPTRLRSVRVPRWRRLWILIAVVVVIVLVVSLRSIATFYTDYLWFGSVQLSSVWRTIFEVKLALFFGFAAIFFVGLWVSLAVVDKVAPSQLALGPEDELVRRYQRYVAPRALLVRSIVALVVALIAASSVIGQWTNYLLFRNGVSFAGPGSKDPQFGLNNGFFVFKLPFLSFLITWSFVSLIVIAILTVIAHYLNGGIRIQQGRPSVSAQVKVHLSVLLACMALVKAAGYYLGRYNLDLSSNGYVQGAGYTDVHARIPAYTLLMVISLLAIVILVVNIWQRGWTLPILAVGLWAFVAIVVGAIYPFAVQKLKVGPAQNSLEKTYIARNISATRSAMGINGIARKSFAADTSATASSLEADTQSLDDVRLWDPEWTANTYTKQQALYTYYSFNTLAMDRYKIAGQLVPMVVGVRQVDSANVPAQGWVNTHLQYTHGYGMVLSPANQASSGQPVFDIGSLPPQSAPGIPQLSQPSVYFGLNNPLGGDASYVIANTAQPEVDYPLPQQNGANQETHYSGAGGVALDNVFTRAAFSLRFSDLNMLISNRVTSKSRVIFVRDVVQMAQKAAPFLSYDSDPYPVMVDGHIDWVIDAYTTTDHYPYGQSADTSSVPGNGGLASQSFNYVRNSVKVVVNAYTGAMTFYDVTSLTKSTDPILQTWEKVFPGMLHPASQMPKSLVAHLRYPEDLFTVQAAAYGRYHLTNVQSFYSSSGAWNLSQSPGAGAPESALPTTITTNAQGQVVSTSQTRMAPLYETFQLPGQSGVSFNLIDAYVPFSPTNPRQTLAGFLVAGNDPGSYGKLISYVTPGQDTDGPALIDSRITQNATVSKDISLLNTNGSQVILGNVLMLPVGQSMLYFRPLYVQSSRNPVPELTRVIAVYSGPGGNSQVEEGNTLAEALNLVFQGLALPPPSANGASPTQVGPAASALIQNLIAQANQDYQQSQADLKAGNFAAYGTDLANLQSVLSQLQQASGTASKSSAAATSTTTTTTTTTPSGVASRSHRTSARVPSSVAVGSSH